MKTPRILGLAAAALVAAGACGCHAYRYQRSDGATVVGVGVPIGHSDSGSAGLHTMGDRGEKALEALPWHPDVLRANLAATGPVALTQIYRMHDDVLAVDATGRVFCLSARDLTPRWISTLKAPLSAPPAENATHYVFLEVDGRGASWLQWFSRRSGTEGDRSPARLAYSTSSGVSVTTSTAYVGSLGSPVDNKTVESINLADGTPGWGYRTFGRVTATPTVDPTGETLLIVCEDRTITALAANPAGDPPRGVQWEATTLGANVSNPAVTKDWAIVCSEDNFVRCFDVHGGQVRWMRGTDAANRHAPWLLGSAVTRMVKLGGEGSATAKVETYEGWVFVRNELGLHCFDVDTGAPVFRDASADRPLAKVGDWVVTLGTDGRAQLRKGKDLAVSAKADLDFDFLPTNSRDGTIVAANKDGFVFLAVPK